MYTKTKAIVITAVKFNEKSLIVKCFTLSDGLKTYFVRDAFTHKKNNYRIAYFQPFTVLDIEANHKNNGRMEQLREVKVSVQYQTVTTDIVKSTIVMFLSEVLSCSIKEEEKNERLFFCIKDALVWLDTHEEIVNFHLILLLEITKYLGFYPDVSSLEGSFFEISEGVFTPFQGVYSTIEYHTDLFKKLLNLKLENNQNAFHVTERQILLQFLMDYYSAHIDGFKKPKSLKVLKEVFA